MINKKRCVVLGASGFLGKHLINELIKKSYPVLAVGRNKKKLKIIFNNYKNNLKFAEVNFYYKKQISELIREDDIIFDLITTSVPATSIKNPIKEIENNIVPHVNLFIEACEKKVYKIIFTSSGGSIYGDMIKKPFKETDLPKPQSPHAIAKLTVEYYLNYLCLKNNIDFSIFRISNPIGDQQKKIDGFGVIPTFLEQIRNNLPPTLYNNGNLIRDFIHVQDVVEAMVLSLDKKNLHHIYNIGSGFGLRIKEVWKILKKANKSNLNAILGESRSFDVKKVVLDVSRFSKEFYWQPKIDVKKEIYKLGKPIH